MEKKFLKVGKSINFKFNTEGLECDLTPGMVYNISVDRYTDAISLEESSGLSLPSKVYCTQRDERFIDKVINSYNLSESGFTGVMLAGLKGSGKTVMAKVIANKSGLPIINIDKNIRPYILRNLVEKLGDTSVCFLFDELDKVLADYDDSVLLQVLDDGRITDSQGRTVDFKNTIIIMTSNLGSQYLLDGIDADGNISQEAEKEVMEDLQGHFRPEFLNRLDEIIMFKPLSKENIGGIIRLLMDDLNKRLSDREIKVALSPEAEHFVVEHGYDPVYGARPLKRFLQKHVETLSAKLILEDQVRQGDTILIDVKDGALTASVQK